jgi:hypothetical protein
VQAIEDRQVPAVAVRHYHCERGQFRPGQEQPARRLLAPSATQQPLVPGVDLAAGVREPRKVARGGDVLKGLPDLPVPVVLVQRASPVAGQQRGVFPDPQQRGPELPFGGQQHLVALRRLVGLFGGFAFLRDGAGQFLGGQSLRQARIALQQRPHLG